MKKKIVFIAPHLSTGGLPQYLVKQIELIKDECEVYCVEWGDVTGGVLVVQRNKMVKLLGDRLITLEENKHELFAVINKIKPDIIHLQEIPELFMERDVADKLYAPDRKYILIETSHDSGYDPNKNKVYLPDKFLMVSKYQANLYKDINIPCDIVEYPIENKVRTKTREQALRDLGLDPNLKHVINVGLFTPRKNQAEVIEYARQLQNYPIQFHFIGNQADNFKYYWEPLMKNFPKNCKWWNERSDVDSFYEATDLFLFTSRGTGTDHETMPLVIREALSWKTPSLIYNLPVYMGYFDQYNTIEYLGEDIQQNVYKIAEKLFRGTSPHEEIFYTQDGEQKLATYEYHGSVDENIRAYGDAAAQYWYTFIFKELDRGNLKIEPGDVFVDLGANIGMSSKYALSRGASEVHCFEPDSDMITFIQKNVPSAKIYPHAVSSKKEEIELYHWPYNPINPAPAGKEPTYKTTTITLKDAVQMVGKKIDYLKIDIEGAELNIFDNLTSKDCENIEKLMVEYHHSTGIEEFCSQLDRCGFFIEYVDRGNQTFIYARRKKSEKYTFTSRWELNNQKVYYSVDKQINFPILVSLKEYKSDSVLWSFVYDSLPANVEYWMIPVGKEWHNCEADPYFTGIKLCIYNHKTGEQLYEHPYVHQFVNIPTVTLSNSIPYRFNYVEYFVQQKYGKWLNHPYKLVVDAGANVGVFSAYMLENDAASKIVAIECDPKALQDLQRNFKHNTTVTVLPNALSTTMEAVTFYHSPDNPVISSTLSPDELENHKAGVKGNVAVTTPSITIQELINRYGTIDLLKIDIEGGEYDILLKADDSVFSDINHMFIECHFFVNNYKEKYLAVIDKLNRLGYLIEEFVDNQVNMVDAGASECIFARKVK